jgi:hypothetical protein
MASQANAPATAATHNDNSMPRPPTPAMTRATTVDNEDGSAVEMDSLLATNEQVPPADKKDGYVDNVDPVDK